MLEELAGGCGDNQQEICDELVRMHHTRSAGDPEGATEWDYSPPVARYVKDRRGIIIIIVVVVVVAVIIIIITDMY